MQRVVPALAASLRRRGLNRQVAVLLSGFMVIVSGLTKTWFF